MHLLLTLYNIVMFSEVLSRSTMTTKSFNVIFLKTGSWNTSSEQKKTRPRNLWTFQNETLHVASLLKAHHHAVGLLSLKRQSKSVRAHQQRMQMLCQEYDARKRNLAQFPHAVGHSVRLACVWGLVLLNSYSRTTFIDAKKLVYQDIIPTTLMPDSRGPHNRNDSYTIKLTLYETRTFFPNQ